MPEGLFHEGEIDVANNEMADERMLQHIMVNLVWVRMANPPATASDIPDGYRVGGNLESR